MKKAAKLKDVVHDHGHDEKRDVTAAHGKAHAAKKHHKKAAHHKKAHARGK